MLRFECFNSLLETHLPRGDCRWLRIFLYYWVCVFSHMPLRSRSLAAIERHSTLTLWVCSLFHSPAHTRTHDLDYLDDLIIMRDGVEEAGRPPETVCECGTVANSLLLIPASSVLASPPTAINAIQSNGRSTLHYMSSASMWFNKFISRSHSKLSKAIFTLFVVLCVQIWKKSDTHIEKTVTVRSHDHFLWSTTNIQLHHRGCAAHRERYRRWRVKTRKKKLKTSTRSLAKCDHRRRCVWWKRIITSQQCAR